ncbi:hypothetical protein NFJ02_28g65250 [Pycnococcus provasolii]
MLILLAVTNKNSNAADDATRADKEFMMVTRNNADLVGGNNTRNLLQAFSSCTQLMKENPGTLLQCPTGLVCKTQLCNDWILSGHCKDPEVIECGCENIPRVCSGEGCCKEKWHTCDDLANKLGVPAHDLGSLACPEGTSCTDEVCKEKIESHNVVEVWTTSSHCKDPEVIECGCENIPRYCSGEGCCKAEAKWHTCDDLANKLRVPASNLLCPEGFSCIDEVCDGGKIESIYDFCYNSSVETFCGCDNIPRYCSGEGCCKEKWHTCDDVAKKFGLPLWQLACREGYSCTDQPCNGTSSSHGIACYPSKSTFCGCNSSPNVAPISICRGKDCCSSVENNKEEHKQESQESAEELWHVAVFGAILGFCWFELSFVAAIHRCIELFLKTIEDECVVNLKTDAILWFVINVFNSSEVESAHSAAAEESAVDGSTRNGEEESAEEQRENTSDRRDKTVEYIGASLMLGIMAVMDWTQKCILGMIGIFPLPIRAYATWISCSLGLIIATQFCFFDFTFGRFQWFDVQLSKLDWGYWVLFKVLLVFIVLVAGYQIFSLIIFLYLSVRYFRYVIWMPINQWVRQVYSDCCSDRDPYYDRLVQQYNEDIELSEL